MRSTEAMFPASSAESRTIDFKKVETSIEAISAKPSHCAEINVPII
jgi:hypothetical protein